MSKTKVYSLRDHEDFCSLILRGASLEEAAQKIDFHPTTIYRHMASAPELREPYDHAREIAKEYRADRVRDKILSRALDDDAPGTQQALNKAADLWLEEARKGLDSRLEITGGDKPIRIESKEVSLTALLQLAADRGVLEDLGLDRPEPALPAAGEVRTASTEPPASTLPPS